MGGGGTALPLVTAVEPGQGPLRAVGNCRRDRFRINLAKTAELEASGGAR